MSIDGTSAGGELAVLELTEAGGEAWVHARRFGRSEDYLRAATLYGAALAVPGVGGWLDESGLRARQLDCWTRALQGHGAAAQVLIVNPWLSVLPDPALAAWQDGDLDAFEAELRLAELFAPGTLARLLAVMRRYASPDEPAIAVAERLAP
jgi:hypothetical protein